MAGRKNFVPWPSLGVILVCLTISLYRPLTNLASDIYAGRDSSSSVRVIIWNETADMLADHPVFGGGLSGYPTAIAPYHEAKHIEIFQHPHNFVLNFWTETGPAGPNRHHLDFGDFFLQRHCLSEEIQSWLPLGLIAAMTCLLVHGLVDVPYFKNDLAFQFWVLLGMVESLVARPPFEVRV